MLEVNQKNIIDLPQSFEALVDFFHEKRELLLSAHLTHDVRVTNYRIGEINMNMDMARLGQLPAQLRAALKKYTVIDWIINVTSDISGRSIADSQKEALTTRLSQAREDPFLNDFLRIFPNSTLTLTENTICAE